MGCLCGGGMALQRHLDGLGLEFREIRSLGPCSQTPPLQPTGSVLPSHHCETLWGRVNTRYPGGAKPTMDPKQWEWCRGEGSRGSERINIRLQGRSEKKTRLLWPFLHLRNLVPRAYPGFSISLKIKGRNSLGTSGLLFPLLTFSCQSQLTY